MIPARPEKRPHAGRPPRAETGETWWPIFLAAYQDTGSAYLAAAAAGVNVRTARAYRLASAAREREIKHARRVFRDGLQYELVKMARGTSKGNVIACFGRLKATGRRMAERYSEKAVDARVMNVTNNLTVNATPPNAARIMARLSQLALSSAELDALRGDLVDAEIITPTLVAPLTDSLEGDSRVSDTSPER